MCHRVDMASVKRATHSKFWTACYRLPDGRHVQRSARTEDKATALSIALAYERTANAARHARLTQESAARFLAEISAITGTSLNYAEPTAEFFKRWLATSCASAGAGTKRVRTLVSKQFLAFLGPKAGLPLTDVSPAVISAFRDAQVAEGKSAVTVNHTLGVLSQALEDATRSGIFSRNPADGIKVRGKTQPAVRRKALSLEQFNALVAVAEGEWKTFLLVLGLTGARRTEAQLLTWAQIDLKGGVIRLERTKTGDDHGMPLHPALAAHLRGLPGSRVGLVLPALGKKLPVQLSAYFRRALLPKIGIRQEYGAKAGVGRKLAEYSLHSLRHGLATWLAEAGVEERVRMLLIGHESKRVSRGYTHSHGGELAKALEKIVPKA